LILVITPQFNIVYGRRRVGKTTLLLKWGESSGLPTVYWAAVRGTRANLRKEFTQAVWRTLVPETLAPTCDSWEALFGHSPALFQTRRGTLICSYRSTGDLDRGICALGFSLWNELLNEWEFNENIVKTPGVGEYRKGCGYPSWDYAEDERHLCVYHINATYVPSDLYFEELAPGYRR
jgi:hypothetical protein